MVTAAQKEHKTVLEIAKYYTDIFFEDFKKLNIIKPEIVSPATENIDEYIKSPKEMFNCFDTFNKKLDEIIDTNNKISKRVSNS